MRRMFLLLLLITVVSCDEARNIATPVIKEPVLPVTQIYGKNFDVFNDIGGIDGTISIASKHGNNNTESYINIVIEPEGPEEGEFGFSIALYEVPKPGTPLGLLAVGAPGENAVYLYQLLTWGKPGAHMVIKITGSRDGSRFGHAVMFKHGYLLILTGDGEIEKSIPVQESLLP